MKPEILIFHNNEYDYSEWIESNPCGFVFNFCESVGNIFHRASCFTLHQERDEGRRTYYSKHISKYSSKLIDHVKSQEGRKYPWRFCKICLPSCEAEGEK